VENSIRRISKQYGKDVLEKLGISQIELKDVPFGDFESNFSPSTTKYEQ
jgi:hypothetical protein